MKIVIIGGLAMDGLVMKDDMTVNEFLEYLLEQKESLERDITGQIGGISISTEGCSTLIQLQNKVAGELDNYIKNQRNQTPTKRQMDDMVRMLDDSISPRADWDDPEDVLDWINTSAEKLNDPEFARAIYKDGKTAAETMVDILKSNGYGKISNNQSKTEQIINAKMSDLENHGFLLSDFFHEMIPEKEYHEEKNKQS